MEILTDLSAKSQGHSQLVYDAMTNNGIVGLPGVDKVVAEFGFKDLFNLDTILAGDKDKDGEFDAKDMINSNDLTRMIGTSITKIVQEAIEPELMVLDNLFQEVRYDGPGRQIEIGSVGAFHAGEVAEGGEYPESDWNYGEGDMIAVGISKHGLKIRVTEEVIEDNLFDVFGLWLRMAGKAMARHKETAAIQLINEFGYTAFDNVAGATHVDAAQLGSTSGRGIDGVENGTMSADDIFEMYTWLYMRGFVPDTLIMNPLSWRMFMSDAEVREIILKGATLATKRLPSGSGANRGTAHGGLGLRYGNTGVGLDDPTKVSGQNPWVTTLNPIGASWEIQPKYLPTPLKVIVSPYVGYTPADGTTKPLTNLVMADSTRSGLLLTKEGVSIDSWDDPERDIMAMKMKERWGLALFEQGKGVAVARNITVDKNYIFDNVNSQTLSSLDPTVAKPITA